PRRCASSTRSAGRSSRPRTPRRDRPPSRRSASPPSRVAEGMAVSRAGRHPRPGVTHDNRFFLEGLAQRRPPRAPPAAPPPPPPRGPRGRPRQPSPPDGSEGGGGGRPPSSVAAPPPPVPPFAYPNVIVLVDLDEGTRLVSRLVGVEPDDVAIG